jgi:hypothetical protein
MNRHPRFLLGIETCAECMDDERAVFLQSRCAPFFCKNDKYTRCVRKRVMCYLGVWRNEYLVRSAILIDSEEGAYLKKQASTTSTRFTGRMGRR